MNKRLSAKLEGRVQGVGMRMFIKEWAESLDLTGFVSNIEDGAVYAILEGEEQNIQNMIDLYESQKLYVVSGASNWSKITVSLAKIRNVVYSWEDYKGEFDRFEIKREESFTKDQYKAFKHFINNIVK